MAATKPQLSIVGLKTQAEADQEAAERAARREARAILRVKLMAAIRGVARELQISNCADELEFDDQAFNEGRGKGVSPATLRSCLEGTERNYFRLDWILWFAEQSEEIADLLCEVAGRGKPQKSPEEELADLKEIVRSEYPKQADRLLRKAAAPR
jgi:hypothetical protein